MIVAFNVALSDVFGRLYSNVADFGVIAVASLLGCDRRQELSSCWLYDLIRSIGKELKSWSRAEKASLVVPMEFFGTSSSSVFLGDRIYSTVHCWLTRLSLSTVGQGFVWLYWGSSIQYRYDLLKLADVCLGYHSSTRKVNMIDSFPCSAFPLTSSILFVIAGVLTCLNSVAEYFRVRVEEVASSVSFCVGLALCLLYNTQGSVEYTLEVPL